MGKSNEQLRAEIAKLNMQIKEIKQRSKLERQLAEGRRMKGKAEIRKAEAIHGRRTARFGQIRDKFLSEGLPLKKALQRASKEYKSL